MKKISVTITAAFLLLLTACMPTPPSEPMPDQMELGSYGTYSEPTLNVLGLPRQYQDNAGHVSSIEVSAYNNLYPEAIVTFKIQSNEATPEILAGTYWLGVDNTQQLSISTNGHEYEANSTSGRLDITELTYGETSGPAGNPHYGITKIRATFSGTFKQPNLQTDVLVSGSLRIG